MLRSIAVAAALLPLFASPILAAAPAPAGQFANADCNTPAFKAFILARLGHGKGIVSGQQMATRFDFGPITEARTISTTGTAITCEISVEFSGSRSGAAQQIRGRFTAMQKPNGQNGWTWLPGS